MKTILTLSKKCGCTLNIDGADRCDYVDLINQTLFNFAYDSTVSVNFLYSVECGEETTPVLNDDGMSPYSVIIHSLDGVRQKDHDEIKLKNDGWYRIIHAVLPTKKAIEEMQLEKGTVIDSFITVTGFDIPDLVYAFDTEEYKLVKANIITVQTVTDGKLEFKKVFTWKQACWEEIIETINSPLSSTVTYCGKDYFNYCKLEQAYMDKIDDLIKLYTGENGICIQNCDSFSKDNNTDIQIRDYFWMAINAIKYCIDMGMYCKALSILKCVEACNIYSSKTTSNNGDCGCS